MSKRKKLPQVLNKEEVSTLLAYFNDKYNYYDRRLYTYIVLSIGTGVRLSEALNLRWIDINFNEGKINVINGKGGKDRIVYFNNKVKEALLDLQQVQKEYCTVPPILVFTTKKGVKWDNDNCRGKVYEVTEKALNRRIHPHTFRHTHASTLLEQTNNIYLVSQHLGHSNISTTQIYLHLVNNQLRDAINGFEF